MKISSSVRRLLRLSIVAGFLALVPGLALDPAAAQSLDALRAEGVVGERYDGLLVVRTGTPSTVILEFIENVNVQRRKIYADRAAQQGVPVGQVARIYAVEIYEKLPTGAWFLDESGAWKQK